MTMQVTMLQTRMGESGSLLQAGSSYTVSKSFGAMLVGAGFAVDTNATLRPPSTNLSVDDVVTIKAIVKAPGSKADLVARAADGLIDLSVRTIGCSCNTTAGDGGGANFVRITAAAIAAFGFSVSAMAMCAFPDKSGDYWLLDQRNPRLGQVGCFGQPIGAVPSTTAADDCSDYIEGLADYGVKRWGASVLEYEHRNYYLHRNTNLPDYAGLSGPTTTANALLAPPDLEAVGGINWIPGFVINPSASLRIGDNFYAEFLAVKRAGITVHTTAEGALDAQLSFSGTGVTKTPGGSSRNVKIRNFVAYGFAFGMLADKFHGARFGDVFGDCNTLLMLKDSGETVWIEQYKRKPVLTVNAAIAPQTVTVTGLYDAGGLVGLTLAEDVATLGLSTGQRVGNQKLPSAFLSQRRTVTVVDATHVVLQDEPWDSAYATFALTDKSSITWQTGCCGGITEFYPAPGGKVGVRTATALPFQVGHQALLVCGEVAPRGMRAVATRVLSTDFVLDVAWHADLLTLDLKGCELALMANNRRHNTVVDEWGTTEGFAIAAISCDGIRISGATKGGGGLYCDSGSAHIHFANEGGSTGETDLNDPTTRSVVIRQPRCRLTGDLKSTGTALHVDMENHGDSTFVYGAQLSDKGICSIRLTRGVLVAVGITVAGDGRIILDDATDVGVSSIDILHGEVPPDKFIGTPANLQRARSEWRTGGTLHQIAGTWAWWCWDPVTGADRRIATISASGMSAQAIGFTSTGVGSNAAQLDANTNGADIVLTANTAAVVLDATTVPDRYRFRVRNYRPGGDWTIPTTGWGTGVVLRYSLGAAHTKLLAGGEATFTVEDIGGTRYLTVNGHTAA